MQIALNSYIMAAGLPWWGILLIVLGGLIVVAFILLMIFGRRMQQKQSASQENIEAMSQVVSMLVIDKKKLRPADSQLPKQVVAQIPKYARFTKLPIVKAKVGPRVMTLIADPKVFDAIPLKTEVKVAVSGIYITEIKFIRGKVEPMVKKSKNPFKRLAQKALDAQNKDAKDTKKKK